MIDYKSIIKNKELRIKIGRILSIIPDRPYLKMLYFLKTGKHLNLKNPVGFNEKQNWLKLYDKHPEYTDYVDKVKVRDVVEKILGPGYFFPLLGTWKHFRDIDFDSLPNEFVLKCNHDSGSVRIITDKSRINKKELESFFESRLALDFSCLGRNYPYKNVDRCILAEAFIKAEGGINDYKFFCFDGKPVIMFVATDRAVGDTRFDFYDMDFRHLDIVNIHPQSTKGNITKPVCFEEMKEIATKCSQGIKFVRIDLYEVDGKVYFGEFTFTHGGGFWLFKPEHWEKELGDLIRI